MVRWTYKKKKKERKWQGEEEYQAAKQTDTGKLLVKPQLLWILILLEKLFCTIFQYSHSKITVSREELYNKLQRYEFNFLFK